METQDLKRLSNKMSSYQYTNKDGNFNLAKINKKSTSRNLLGNGENILNSQKNIFGTKTQNVSSNKQVERIPLGGKSINNTVNKPFKKSFKRTSSLLLDDSDKKIKVQKDDNHKISKSVSQNVSSSMCRRKGSISNFQEAPSLEINIGSVSPKDDFNYDIEYTPERIEPLKSAPSDFIPLSHSDICFFTSKSPIPEKKAIQELDSKLDMMMDFETIPVLKYDNLENKLDFDLIDTDSLIKKQPRILPKCEPLKGKKIPHLKHVNFQEIKMDEFKDGNDNPYLESPIMRINIHNDVREDDFTDEGLTYDDMESLIM